MGTNRPDQSCWQGQAGLLWNVWVWGQVPKENLLVHHEHGAGISYSSRSGCRSAAEWEQQRPSTFTRIQSRTMLLIAGLNLEHISSYGYKNEFFYLPAGRSPTNPEEASVNCWDLNCFKIRPLIFIKLLNDDDCRRYYRRDVLWHGSI